MSDLLNLDVPHFAIKTNGSLLPDDLTMLECSVESSIHMPDLCTMRISDDNFKWIDDPRLTEGNQLDVSVGYGERLTDVFRGEIVGLEMDLSGDHGPTLTVRAYDKSHRLHRGRKNRTFVDVKDSDIVSKIAGEHGLSSDIDATKVTRKWMIQNNETDWEFLTNLANRNGFDMFMSMGKLYFRTAGQRKQFAVVSLEYGDNIISFRPRTRTSQQLGTVEVRGWDPKTKKEIVGIAKEQKGAPKIGGEPDGGKVAAKAFGGGKTVVVDQPIHSQEEAELLAQSIRDQIGQDFLTADGSCQGTPLLMAGSAIEIKNVGTRFSGTYFVSSATHILSDGGYYTQFTVSGTEPNNIISMLAGGSAGGTTSDVGGNITVGIVTDNKDPEKLGRVKVKYPWMGDDVQSFWARIVSQMAGKGRGFFNLPEINDEVLIAFEHGDPTRPYVLGQLWNGVDKPPTLAGGAGGGSMETGPQKPKNDEEVSGGKVDRRGYYTRIGHKLDFSDTDGEGYAWLSSAAGEELVLSDKEQGLWLRTPGGHWLMLSDKHKGIKIHSSGGHQVFLDDMGKKIVLTDSGGNKLTMDATGGSISLKANVEINLAAPQININADMALNQEAAKISIQGKINVDIKGLMVMINS